MPDLRALLCSLVAALASACASSPAISPNVPLEPAGRQAEVGKRIARAALDLLGTPYRYGGNTPDGFDCSGLVQYAHAQVGLSVPRTTAAQYRGAPTADTLREGDVLFFRIGGRISHSGIYLGRGRFVHAPSSGKQVSVADTDNLYFRRRFAGARRLH